MIRRTAVRETLHIMEALLIKCYLKSLEHHGIMVSRGLRGGVQFGSHYAERLHSRHNDKNCSLIKKKTDEKLQSMKIVLVWCVVYTMMLRIPESAEHPLNNCHPYPQNVDED